MSMSQQEELINKLTQRIQILVNEVETLTAIIDSNIIDQQDVVQKYNSLLEAYKLQEQELVDTQNKLNQAFKHNIKDHLEYIDKDRQHINQLLSAQRNDLQAGPDHPLYQLCQQKTSETQELRGKLYQLEQVNYELHAENCRLKSYVQHEKMFRQLEMMNGNYQARTVAPNQPVEVPQLAESVHEKKHLQQYLQSKDVDRIKYTAERIHAADRAQVDMSTHELHRQQYGRLASRQ